jgi:hypothetical protein
MKLTRQQLIDYVRTKLDEHSPFDEPQSFIAAAGDPDYDKVKPIVKYIDDLLNEAANDCLRMLPLTLVGADVQKLICPEISIDDDEVVRIKLSTQNLLNARFTRVKATLWKKEVTSFITSSNPMYLLQQDEDARGKLCKPIVAIVPEKDCLELYSFPGMAGKTTNTDVFYISCNKEAENIVSDIDELVAIRCAELLCNVFGSQSAQVFQKEFAEKNNSVLQ